MREVGLESMARSCVRGFIQGHRFVTFYFPDGDSQAAESVWLDLVSTRNSTA